MREDNCSYVSVGRNIRKSEMMRICGHKTLKETSPYYNTEIKGRYFKEIGRDVLKYFYKENDGFKEWKNVVIKEVKVKDGEFLTDKDVLL